MDEEHRRFRAAVRDSAAVAALVVVWLLQAGRRATLHLAATMHAAASVGALFGVRAGHAARRHTAWLIATLTPLAQRTWSRAATLGRRARPALAGAWGHTRRIAGWVAAAVASAASSLEGSARAAGVRASRRTRDVADDLQLSRVTRSAIGVVAIVACIAALGVAMVTPAVIAADRVLTEARGTIDDVPPLPDDLGTPAQRSRITASDGSVLAYLAEENRIVVDLERVPEQTRDAVLAIEDARFYEHDGVDFRGLGRAVVTNLQRGQVAEGGSTITQQYVKNALLSPEQTLDRKITEALYAVELERQRTKDEILEGYLNVAYFGNGVYGIATAAEFYFGLDVEDLELAQSALLAGLIANPTTFDPIQDPDMAQQRRDVVLRNMVDLNVVERDAADEALDQPLEVDPQPLPEPSDPFFVDYVLSELLRDPALGETRQDRAHVLFTGGLEIETTLDPTMQEHAEDAISEHLTDPAEDPLGAIVSLDPETGAVKALGLGPREFGDCPEDDEECPDTQVNPVVPGMGGSGRQGGSAFKPLILAAALEDGLGTDWSAEADSGTEIEDCGVPGEPWEVRNYDRGEPGTIDMVEAIRVSNNVYHAKVIAEIGPPSAVEMAERLGIRSELSEVCAIALGAADVFPIEMATAFGTFANDGVRCDPAVVTEVTDADGEVILEHEPSCEQVIDEEIAATMTTMLREVIDEGTGTRAQIGRDAAGKTGTTDDHRDAWFVGYVPQLVTATWIGYEVPEEMRGILGHDSIAGGTVPAALWSSFMSAALHDIEPEPLPSVSLDRYVADDDDDDDGDGGGGGDGRGPDGDGPPGQDD